MPEHKGWYTRGYLPHYDAPGRPQFITYRLGDSLPAPVLDRIYAETEGGVLERRREMERYLDAGYGKCWLRRPDCARIVIENLQHHDNKRYELIDWVVMPNHAHVAYDRPRDTLKRITHGWKSFTSKKINSRLGLSGKLWQTECFDRVIRDEQHLWNIRCYIYLNPVKAKLVKDPFEWPFSSIHDRDVSRDSLRRWLAKWKDKFWSIHD